MGENSLDCELIGLYHLLGKKWIMTLLHNIRVQPLTYNELDQITGKRVSSILLSKRLKEMQRFRLVKKEKIHGQTLYIITPQGIELIRILDQIKLWAIGSGYNMPKTCLKNPNTYCELYECQLIEKKN